MSPRQKLQDFFETASRSQLMVYACLLGLVGLAFMSWSLFDQGWIPVMMAMSVGQGIGTLSLLLFVAVTIMALRRADFRPSLPNPPPRKTDD
jgi:CHASE2 domain-containing sensor protein